MVWCATCQAFANGIDRVEQHPHSLAEYDHSETCAWCAMFDQFSRRSESHLGSHARALGWRECGDCFGWYPSHVDEEDHSSTAWRNDLSGLVCTPHDKFKLPVIAGRRRSADASPTRSSPSHDSAFGSVARHPGRPGPQPPATARRSPAGHDHLTECERGPDSAPG